MWRGISLANKCLLLFGGAVVMIILAALGVSWFRMTNVVDETQHEVSRQFVQVWRSTTGFAGLSGAVPTGKPIQVAGAELVVLSAPEAEAAGQNDPFIKDAWKRFGDDEALAETTSAHWKGVGREYRYALAIRRTDGRSASGEQRREWRRWRGGGSGAERGGLEGMLVLMRPSSAAPGQLFVNMAYLFSAGLIALGLAVLVFYLITSRLILSPVRSLKDTAEMVREGNFSTRAEIHTGDEFEELGETFNQMLEALTTSQDQLRSINTSLDLKVNELAQKNVALYEANKLKGEFLANVSHELRTPLNSIVGFTDLLLEIAERESEAGDDSTRLQKRRRYLENIQSSGRNLLELINDLLEMAKLEAGKMDVKVEPVVVRDSCEALVALIRPLADRAGVDLVTELAPDLPAVETDPKKFQQIIFNLLSNAVKFTGEKYAGGATGGGSGAASGTPASARGAETSDNGPVSSSTSGPPPHEHARGARVTLRAERLVGRASEGAGSIDRLRISVLDTGPGIAPDDLPRLFEKFQQLEAGHTRRHAGTGLGLAISKELASLIQGEIQVESELGRGSMFSLILPMHLDPGRAQEMKLELAFRGRLAGQKDAG